MIPRARIVASQTVIFAAGFAFGIYFAGTAHYLMLPLLAASMVLVGVGAILSPWR